MLTNEEVKAYLEIEKTEIRSNSQWFEVLGDVFEEHLVNFSSQERDDLWGRVWNKHEEWKQTTKRSRQ